LSKNGSFIRTVLGERESKVSRNRFAPLGIFLISFVPILIVNLKGTLNVFSISVLKLAEEIIKTGHHQVYPLHDGYGLPKEINFRSEWSASPIMLAVISLITGIPPFIVKSAPFGILMIFSSALLAKCLRFGWHLIAAYSILTSFSATVIFLNDYSQFLMGFLLLFIMLSLWISEASISYRRQVTTLLLLVLFFISLEYYYVIPFLFLIFITGANFIFLLQKKFKKSSSNNIQLYSSLLLSLWMMFLSKVLLHSIIYSYYFGGGLYKIIWQGSLYISSILDFISSIISGEVENVAQLNPRAANFFVQLTTALFVSSISFSILVWLIRKEVRKPLWLYIGSGIILTSIAEFIPYLFSGHVGIYALFTRTFLLLGPLLSLHVVMELFKRRKTQIVAIILLSLLFFGQIGGWFARVGDERTYHSMYAITGYQTQVPIAYFLTSLSEPDQMILTSSEMSFLIMAFGDISRASHISSFGKYASILDSPDSSLLPTGVIIVLSKLFEHVKPIYASAGIYKSPSEIYFLNLDNSNRFSKVYDGNGVMYYYVP